MKNALLVILIIFWKILVFFPRRFQDFIAIVLGHFIYWLPLKRNRISKVNIDLCFKDLSQKDRDNIHKKNTIEFAKVIFDTGISWFWSDNRIKKNIPYKINAVIKSDLNLERENSNAIIINATGKLDSLYDFAEIAFIGGSLFNKYGGHNLIEAAKNKCAIIVGPYMKNFEDILQEHFC